MRTPDRWFSAWALVVFVISGGCTVSTGAKGTLGFGYRAADQLAANRLDAALAIGEEIDVVVYAAEQPGEPQNYATWMGKRELAGDRVEPVAVRRARSSDPAVLAVSGVQGSRIRLRGISAGTVGLEVQSDAGRDRIAVRVAEVGHVAIDHWAWGDGQRTGPTRTVLLRGGVAHFFLERRSESGQRLTGYGAGAAVLIEPEAAASVENRARDTKHLRVRPTRLGRLTLTPDRGTGLSMQVVDPDDVVELELELAQPSAGDDPSTVAVDSGRWYVVRARVADGRRVLGLDGPLQLHITDTSICELEQLNRWFGDGLMAVRGLSAGRCRIRARLGRATAELSLAVVAKR